MGADAGEVITQGIAFPREMLDELREVARREDMTISQLVRSGVRREFAVRSDFAGVSHRDQLVDSGSPI